MELHHRTHVAKNGSYSCAGPKPEHVGVACDFAALFARSLAVLCSHLFKAYLHPGRQHDLEEAVRLLMYGGRESYEHRNQLYRLLKEHKIRNGEQDDLGLPERQRLIKLVRQLLDAPVDVTRSPLILREFSFSYINDSTDRSFARTLCQECPQAGRFAVLLAGYLFRAVRLPGEFQEAVESSLLGRGCPVRC